MKHEGNAAATEIVPDEGTALAEQYQQFEQDKVHDECGVFGIYAPGFPVGTIAWNAGLAQEHRGHSGSGMAYYDPATGAMQVAKNIGRVHEAIPHMMPVDGQTPAERVSSHLALFHNRYSTDESDHIDAVHPHQGPKTGVTLAHNGQFSARRLLPLAKRYGVSPEAPSETALLTHIIDASFAEAEQRQGQPLTTESIGRTLANVLARVDGSYCLTMAYQDKLLAVRDPWGRHPLSIGSLPGRAGTVVASEMVTLGDLGLPVGDIREVKLGEIVVVDRSGPQSFTIPREAVAALCVFESLYTTREHDIVYGAPNYEARYKIGQRLAAAAPAPATMVIGVPKSGLLYAEGYADAAGIPYVPVIQKNPHVEDQRTFILRGEQRKRLLEAKFVLDKELVPQLHGESVVVVDDSGIKGTVGRHIAHLLRAAGAAEIHLRYGAPAYQKPCHHGMDTSNESELIARHDRSLEVIAADLGADSVAYNSFADVESAIDEAKAELEAAKGTNTARLIGKFCRQCAMPGAANDYPEPGDPGYDGRHLAVA